MKYSQPCKTKLMMSKIYHNFINKRIDAQYWQLIHMDNVSTYINLSGNSLNSLIETILKKKYYTTKKTKLFVHSNYHERTLVYPE